MKVPIIKEIGCENSAFDDHKHLFWINDENVGLNAYVAIHNDSFGSAIGGTRMYAYGSREDAVTDVLRLSKAMTYKCIIAGVHHGGGKGVIIGDPKVNKNNALLRSYAESINRLTCVFYTGEDVGITENDVQYMLKFSQRFIGDRDKAGDPSPFAAQSTFYAMRAATKHFFGTNKFNNRTIVIKGIGKVGSFLTRILHDAGAKLTIADIDRRAISQMIGNYPDVEVVEPKDAHKVKCDIYSPCALGNEFTDETIKELNTSIICGAANNQLASPLTGEFLFAKNILYIPDYIANSGGLINVVDELSHDGYNRKRVEKKVMSVERIVDDLIVSSHQQKKPLCKIADAKVEQLLKERKNENKQRWPAL